MGLTEREEEHEFGTSCKGAEAERVDERQGCWRMSSKRYINRVEKEITSVRCFEYQEAR